MGHIFFLTYYFFTSSSEKKPTHFSPLLTDRRAAYQAFQHVTVSWTLLVTEVHQRYNCKWQWFHLLFLPRSFNCWRFRRQNWRMQAQKHVSKPCLFLHLALLYSTLYYRIMQTVKANVYILLVALDLQSLDLHVFEKPNLQIKTRNTMCLGLFLKKHG